MPKKKKEYVRTTFYSHPIIQNEFVKKIKEENENKSKELERKRGVSEVMRHLQIMYINFGEDLFKITKL